MRHLLAVATVTLLLTPFLAALPTQAATGTPLFGMLDRETATSAAAVWFTAEEMNPSAGVYRWAVVEAKLSRFTKPVHLWGFAVVSLGPAGSVGYRVTYPRWWGAPHEVTVGGQKGYFPPYDSATWRSRYADLVRALGERYDGDPRLVHIAVGFGLDNENSIAKGAWREATKFLEYRHGQWVYEGIEVWAASFTKTSLFLNNSVGGEARRAWGSRAVERGMGIKLVLGTDLPDMVAWVTTADPASITGALSILELYPGTPLMVESQHGMGGSRHTLWLWALAQRLGAVALSLHPEHITALASLDLPQGQWVMFRDREYAPTCWSGKCVSGYPGDFARGIRIVATGTRLWAANFPAGGDHPIIYQAREGTFALEITPPADNAAVRITYLDHGFAPFTVNGQMIQRRNTGQWQTAIINLARATTLTIGPDVHLHRVEVWPGASPTATAIPPTMTATSTASATSTRTATCTATLSPSATPTCRSTATMTPQPSTSTATRTAPATTATVIPTKTAAPEPTCWSCVQRGDEMTCLHMECERW